MAFGYGPGSEMVKAVNAQRSSRKKGSLKMNSDATEIKSFKPALKYKKATPEQLAEIRTQMRESNKKKRTISLIVGTVVLLFILFALTQFNTILSF